MTNAQSKLFSSSSLPATRNWGRNVSFLDASAERVKRLIGNSDNVGFFYAVNLEEDVVPIFSPMFADKENDQDPEVEAFYILGNSEDVIPSKSIMKAPATTYYMQ